MRRLLPLSMIAGLLGAGLLTSPAKPQASGPSRYLSARQPPEADRFYQLVWGVDGLSAKLLESGELIRFTYTVLDPAKAKTLNDQKLQPVLEDPKANVKLVIPQMEKVGMLRQVSTPQPGKAYWMAFSNKGGVVKHGDRINVVIGTFHADGLVVE